VTYEDLDLSDLDFVQLGESFAHETGLERQGRVGYALARLMPQRSLVDYAVAWLEVNR
jgi:aminoglycoside 3-N-acetyltransferase